MGRADSRRRIFVSALALFSFVMMVRYIGRADSVEERRKRVKSTVLNGPPAASFQENLRNDTFYVTAWPSAGFTNQFMGYVNMIYLATISDRIPIVPPFSSYKIIGTDAGLLPFGDLFDLEYLSHHLQLPVLEWRDVKRIPKPTDVDPYPYIPHSKTHISEPLGCWSTRGSIDAHPARCDPIVQHIGLDVAYTRIPNSSRYKPSDPQEIHVTFPHLTALIYRSPSALFTDLAPPPYVNPQISSGKYEYMAPSPEGKDIEPDTHIACFDSLYFATSGVVPFEWKYGFSPAWRVVGKYLRFRREFEVIAREYLDAIFPRELPPFIAVHARRGDFNWDCGKGVCLPPVSAYQKPVDEVKKELREKRGIEVEHVIFMSDESSPSFWEDVQKNGWLNIDHKARRTIERYGQWYPTLIDIIIQSYATGFVGTEHSTLSLVSQRRVMDWNGGAVRSVDIYSEEWLL